MAASHPGGWPNLLIGLFLFGDFLGESGAGARTENIHLAGEKYA